MTSLKVHYLTRKGLPSWKHNSHPADVTMALHLKYGSASRYISQIIQSKDFEHNVKAKSEERGRQIYEIPK